MSDLWIKKSIPLKYLLGEIPICKFSLPAIVFAGHFSTLNENPDEQSLPLDSLSANTEAVLIRSHPIEDKLPKYSSSKRYIRYVPAQYQRYYIDLAGAFTDYLAKFSPKTRSTLQRKVRKYVEYAGATVPWKEYKEPDEMSEFFKLAREVSSKTYQERLMDVGLPSSDEFVNEMNQLAQSGKVRAYILFDKSKPIAYLYCPIADNILLYDHLGFDPDYKQHSPGTVLQYLVLESLFSEGKYKMFDFTEGQGPHKEFFATGSKLCADLYYFRPTFKNMLLLKSHSGLGKFTHLIVKSLDDFGLKAKIKKMIRSK